jgi:hypothetical protein
MNQPNGDEDRPIGNNVASPIVALVSSVTAVALIACMFALAWMVLAAFQPEVAHFASIEVEIVIVTVLFASALMLVSVLALLETVG